MSKVQELVNLVSKQSQATKDNVESSDVVPNLNAKSVHSNHSDLAPKGPNKNPPNVGWAPGMMFIPPGEGTNRGF